MYIYIYIRVVQKFLSLCSEFRFFGQLCVGITYTERRRCPWCSRYRRRKWTRRHEFKSWTRHCISHSTNTLGEGMNPVILQLWVNNRAD